jgi:Methyltransferase domain
MLGLPLRYLLKHPAAIADLAADPIQVWSTACDVYVAQREQRKPHCPYEANPVWEQWLHASLGAPWPCPSLWEFKTLWLDVVAELGAKGIRAGPESFGSWNDGDTGLVRAIWCVVRHSRPKNVVETGVAHGVTSRFILEAMKRNGEGRLWSIDLPPLEKHWREQVAVAVGDRGRWTYLAGSSRRRLPGLLSELGQIDLFVHDSLHSERNVRFELDRAWAVLKPGAAMVVDDVDANWGFRSFTREFPVEKSAICEAEPLHPDLRRFNQKGLFGIIFKEPAAPLSRSATAGGGR